MASNTFGGTVRLDGESEYRKALSNISAQLKVFSTDMSKLTEIYGKNNDSMEGNARKSQVLNERLKTQQERVNILKSALEQSKQEFGENDKRTLQWQASLNKAETEVLKTEKDIAKLSDGVEDNTDDLKDNTKEVKTSESGWSSWGQTLADLRTKVIEGAFQAIKNLTGAMVDIGKQAVASYGDFQQLEGGVKTLFGTEAKSLEEYAELVGKSTSECKDEYESLLRAQQTVFNDANNAYKTAGMSANQYMETVTAFSASLISSLNGDREAAAAASKQAVTDMADNANKMGTSLEQIESAYKGFAKQNYTMLD